MRKMIVLFLFTMLFSACASAPRKRTFEPAIQIPESWSSSTGAGGLDSLWWTNFKDDGLNAVIDEALHHNFTLRIAEAGLSAAQAQAKIAGSSMLPQVGAGFNGSRRKQNFIGLPIPSAGGGILTNTSTSYGVSMDLSWELDLWGRIRAGTSAAHAEIQATEADLRGAKLSLIGQVCKAWFATVEANHQLALAKATFENLRNATAQIEARYQRGIRRSLELRLSRSNLASAEAILQVRKGQQNRTLRQLEILLGRYPAAKLEVTPDLPFLQREIPAGLPATLIARRPDLVAAERRLAGSHAKIWQAKAAMLPKFAITTSGGTSTKELGDLLNGDFSVWSILGNVLQPLFQGGRLRAGVKLAKSQKEIALALYGQTTLQAFAEVEFSLVNEKLLAAREKALTTASTEAAAAQTLAEQQYSRGVVNFITLLEAQRRAYTSRSQLLSVQRERLDARIDLHLALGGGFEMKNEKTDEGK